MPERAHEEVSDAMLRRIYGEFLEMPGMRLTLSQAQRLWGLDEGPARRCSITLSTRNSCVDPHMQLRSKQRRPRRIPAPTHGESRHRGVCKCESSMNDGISSNADAVDARSARLPRYFVAALMPAIFRTPSRSVRLFTGIRTPRPSA